jgi:transcriptional regulator with XRE-family HTH domain
VVEENVPALAGNLKTLRQAKGLTQQALASAAGISMSVVFQIEQGARGDPRISTVVALARALGVTMDQLVSNAPAEPASPPKAEAKPKRRRKGK